jgi:hypothetical protein
MALRLRHRFAGSKHGPDDPSVLVGNRNRCGVKATEAGGPRGYDAGKKVNGRKRHVVVDTDGRALLLEPDPASIQDRDGGGPLLRASRALYPFIARVSPIAVTTTSGSRTPRTSSSKLSGRSPARSASSFCRVDGWLSASSPESAETEGLRKVSKR